MADTHTSRSWEGIRLNGMPTLTFVGTQNRNAIYLNNTSYRVGVMFEVPEDMNITGGAVFFNTCGAGNKYKWELWPASTTTAGSADTSGTVLAESGSILGAVGRQENTFTSPYAASKGDVLVLSLTVTERANSWQLLMGANAHDAFLPASIYSWNSGSSWNPTSDTWPGIEVTTNKDYYLGGIAHDYPDLYSPGNTSNYRIVNRVRLPEETNGIDFHVSGFYYAGALSTSYADCEFRVGVWDYAGDVVVPVKTYNYPSGFGAQPQYEHGCELLFSSPVKMTSGNDYYVGFQFVDATGRITVFDLAGDSAMKAWPGGGWMKCFIREAGSWLEFAGDTASGIDGRLPMNLILTDVHGAVQGVEVKGKGSDSTEKCPSRVKHTGKPGFKENAPKVISRENTAFGWSPFE